ncbi:MAG: hypothetical protein AABW92_03380 [Nanoarchaeota archaeon]
MGKYTCYKCKKEYGSDEIRLNADKQLICVSCLMGKKTVEPKKIVIDEPVIEYLCNNCHYSFKRKESIKFKLCPYCGKEGKVVPMKNMDSGKILKDSMDARYSY